MLARILAQRFQDNPAARIEGIAAEEGFGATYAARLLRLTHSPPNIVTAILDGRQPPELTANMLMADTRLSLEWSAQRATREGRLALLCRILDNYNSRVEELAEAVSQEIGAPLPFAREAKV